jgi:hypothetical protein
MAAKLLEVHPSALEELKLALNWFWNETKLRLLSFQPK